MALVVYCSDSFNRANVNLNGNAVDNALGGSASEVWTSQSGDWAVSGNRAAVGIGGSSSVINLNGVVDADEQQVTASVHGTGTGGALLGLGVMARWQTGSSGGNGYLYYADDGSLYRKTGTTFDVLGTGGAVAPDDTIRIYAVGTAIKCYINGVEHISVSDGTYTTGKVGMYSSGHGTVPTIDNFVYEIAAGGGGGSTSPGYQSPFGWT